MGLGFEQFKISLIFFFFFKSQMSNEIELNSHLRLIWIIKMGIELSNLKSFNAIYTSQYPTSFKIMSYTLKIVQNFIQKK